MSEILHFFKITHWTLLPRIFFQQEFMPLSRIFTKLSALKKKADVLLPASNSDEQLPAQSIQARLFEKLCTEIKNKVL